MMIFLLYKYGRTQISSQSPCDGVQCTNCLIMTLQNKTSSNLTIKPAGAVQFYAAEVLHFECFLPRFLSLFNE